VTLFSVKPNNFIKANVEISEAGIATAAMNVDRQDFMNSKTVMLARMLPTTKWPWISCKSGQNIARLILNDGDLNVAGQQGLRPWQPVFKSLDHADGVFAALPLHLQHDGWLAVQSGQRADFFRRVANLA